MTPSPILQRNATKISPDIKPFNLVSKTRPYSNRPNSDICTAIAICRPCFTGLPKIQLYRSNGSQECFDPAPSLRSSVCLRGNEAARTRRHSGTGAQLVLPRSECASCRCEKEARSKLWRRTILVKHKGVLLPPNISLSLRSSRARYTHARTHAPTTICLWDGPRKRGWTQDRKARSFRRGIVLLQFGPLFDLLLFFIPSPSHFAQAYTCRAVSKSARQTRDLIFCSRWALVTKTRCGGPHRLKLAGR